MQPAFAPSRNTDDVVPGALVLDARQPRVVAQATLGAAEGHRLQAQHRHRRRRHAQAAVGDVLHGSDAPACCGWRRRAAATAVEDVAQLAHNC